MSRYSIFIRRNEVSRLVFNEKYWNLIVANSEKLVSHTDDYGKFLLQKRVNNYSGLEYFCNLVETCRLNNISILKASKDIGIDIEYLMYARNVLDEYLEKLNNNKSSTHKNKIENNIDNDQRFLRSEDANYSIFDWLVENPNIVQEIQQNLNIGDIDMSEENELDIKQILAISIVLNIDYLYDQYKEAVQQYYSN